jgi:predicted TIM-barrel fold metal-dependent hydrolase
MLGVRLTFARGAARWLSDGTADWFWWEAQAASVPVMVFTPERVHALVPVLQRFPELRLVIDHAGLPTYPPPIPMKTIIAEAAALATFPNVAVKASAFPCATTEPFPFPAAQWCTRALVEAFGPERVFWGTDMTRLPCSYTEAVQYLARSGGLTAAQLPLVMGRGILDWLGWNVE